MIEWFKSTYSGPNGACVEVSRLTDGYVALRSSRNPELPPPVFTLDEWRAFVAGVKAGQFDLDLDTYDER